MRLKRCNALAYIIIILLVVIAIVPYFNKPLEKPTTVFQTDTVWIVKYDTIELVSPIFKEKKIIDTIYIYTSDSSKIILPIEQKYYKEDGRYEAWVSGYNPSLDKINVFNKTEYKTITNTETKTIYPPKKTQGYLYGQVSYFDQNYIPTLNVGITFPRGFYLNGGIGVFGNKPVYNIGAGYKIW